MKSGVELKEEVVTAIREIVEQDMRRFGLKSVKVEVANDHDGEPAIWIATHYGKDGAPVEMRALAELGSKIRERLLDLGEDRFPHLRYQFPENHKIAS